LKTNKKNLKLTHAKRLFGAAFCFFVTNEETAKKNHNARALFSSPIWVFCLDVVCFLLLHYYKPNNFVGGPKTKPEK
jgi:hypothetical protein